MGKQISFYMSENVQLDFINFLEENGFVFLNNDATTIEQVAADCVFSAYLYKQAYGDIIMRQDGLVSIDSIKTPVIEFNKTIVKVEAKRILRGRLWMSNQYDEEIRIDKIRKDYQVLVRWIKRNVPYQEIAKGDYIVNEYVNDELKELQRKGFILTM